MHPKNILRYILTLLEQGAPPKEHLTWVGLIAVWILILMVLSLGYVIKSKLIPALLATAPFTVHFRNEIC
jgi:hypothetical protein